MTKKVSGGGQNNTKMFVVGVKRQKKSLEGGLGYKKTPKGVKIVSKK